MNTITHDQAISLHMGKLEEIRSLLALVADDYNATWKSETYRMRDGDIKRAKKYLSAIRKETASLSQTMRKFEYINAKK